MPRRKADGLLDILADALHDRFMVQPWWAPVAMSVAVYALVHFGLRSPAGDFLAGVASVIILLIGLAAFLSRSRRQALLDGQTGLDSIRAMSWQHFERLVGEAYRRQGYLVEERGGGGADGGVDLVLRGNAERVLVQCKQWKTHRVGPGPVRELLGVLTSEKATRGIFVTCGTYTDDALAFARQNTALELVDGSALLSLIRGVQTGHSTPRESPAGLGPVIEWASPTPGMTPAVPPDRVPCCPVCQRAMILRTAGKGSYAGTQFWGCPAFPNCRGRRRLGGRA